MNYSIYAGIPIKAFIVDYASSADILHVNRKKHCLKLNICTIEKTNNITGHKCIKI